MKANPAYPVWSHFALDRATDMPLQEQIVRHFREAISLGKLGAGARMPPSRALAAELGVARNTVAVSYDILAAEGYLTSRSGAGTFVADGLPAARPAVAQATPARLPSQRGQRAQQAGGGIMTRGMAPLTPGLPALDHFPFALWARLTSRYWRGAQRALLPYGEPGGYPPLRAALARYLSAARGIGCAPEQVLIVAGSQAGIDTVARVLLDPGDAVWVEDPGYVAGRNALAASGARLVPVPVDEAGLDPLRGEALAPRAKLAMVTPSHQYPFGSLLTLPRRLALLDWAERADAWILEDDYDGEFRYAGKPASALHALDTSGRVLYLGTLSKILAPSLRIGYLVVPPDLIDVFAAARAVCDRHVPTDTQAVLCDFIEAGHLAAHVRRLKPVYDERRLALKEALRGSGQLEALDYGAGLHMVARLNDGCSDVAASARAAQLGVNAPPLSSYALARDDLNGFVLGFANTPPALARPAVERLLEAIRGQEVVTEIYSSRPR